MHSSNNAALAYYSDEVYQMADITSTLSTALTAAIWVMLLIGTIGGKLVAVEMLAVFQIAFFGLIVI